MPCVVVAVFKPTASFGLSQVVGLATRFYLARIVLFWLVEDLLFSFL